MTVRDTMQMDAGASVTYLTATPLQNKPFNGISVGLSGTVNGNLK